MILDSELPLSSVSNSYCVLRVAYFRNGLHLDGDFAMMRFLAADVKDYEGFPEEVYLLVAEYPQ